MHPLISVFICLFEPWLLVFPLISRRNLLLLCFAPSLNDLKNMAEQVKLQTQVKTAANKSEDDTNPKSDFQGDNTVDEAEEIPSAAEEDQKASKQEESDDDEGTSGIKLETAPGDIRLPTANQTRHCFARYIEYHRCIVVKGDGAPECQKFARYYRSLCPGEWIVKWNEQRANGTFPGPL